MNLTRAGRSPDAYCDAACALHVVAASATDIDAADTVEAMPATTAVNTTP
ncbi:MAG: hypothetical protein IPO20_14660 [Gammaproteobacteria bacterium]|nr:hypothetical protein [Gammaproteobacteria bacterium]